MMSLAARQRVFAVMSSASLLMVAAGASGQTLWQGAQITSTLSPESWVNAQGVPALSGDGSTIAFYSNSDLGGLNPLLSPELFVYRLGPGTLERLTDHSEPAGFLPNNDPPRISGDGGLVLDKWYEFPGGWQWYLYNTLDREKTGIPGVGTFLNPSGTFVLFVSTQDLTGENGDGSWELFRYTIADGTVAQITHDVLVYQAEAVASDDGAMVFVISPDDLVPGGNPLGAPELFVLHVFTGSWTQLTSGPTGGVFTRLSVSDDGSRVVFSTSSDLTGANPDYSTEVFLVDVPGGSIRQVTNGDHPIDGTRGSVSGDGSTVAIISSQDLTGANPDRNSELFVYDVGGQVLTQVTDTQTTGIALAPPAVDSSGNAVAVHASADFVGGNPDGNVEIFMLSAPGGPPPAVPVGGGPFSFVLAVVIGVTGVHALRRGVV